ncbi:MAG: DUF3035 domain-containing protein [Phenylobacterium sp.]
MKLQHIAVIAVLAGATGLAGCQSTRQALGMTKVTPDEFRVVSKAPLVVPPDFALRPPAPGQPRPQELQPESAARNALIGRSLAETRSDGEELLIAKAGGDKADPLIRFVIDDENGDIAHKEKSFADRVMFWKPGEPRSPTVAAAEADNAPAPIDPAAEEARIKSLIGDKTVVIARERSSRIKIPGL